MSELQARVARAFEPRYQFLRELGRGGMGIVYLFTDTVLERPVAIKILKPEVTTAVTQERFLREARTLARLQHPNVVRIMDTGERDGVPYIIMEFLEGSTLRQRLDAGERLSIAQVRTLGLQLLDALGPAHAAGIVHRDLKPANIFFDGGAARLVDFGIASEPTLEGDSLTRTGQLLGTHDYMSPEQRTGRQVDGRADLYSLALVLFEALTGHLPAPLKPLPWKRVSRPLIVVLQRALAPEPADRWPDASSFREALVRSGRLPRRRLVLAFLAVAALALAVWLLMGPPGPPTTTVPRQDDLAMLPLDDGGNGDLGRNLTRRVVDVLEPFPPLRVSPASETEEWLAKRRGIVGTAMPPGVSRYADGTVTLRGDSLLLLLTVREQGARPVEKLAVSGDTADLWRLAHDVADSLVRRLAPRDAQEFENIRHRPIDLATSNLYFRGKDAFRRGAWEEADRQFSAALARDSQFVQAAWGLMIARRYQRTPFGEVLVTLLRHADALPPFQRRLLEAMNEPDLEERLRRYDTLVQSSHGSGEALLHYTNELFHRGALVGRPLAVTLDTMSLLADSVRDLAHASTYDLTIWGNVRLGREAQAWQQFRRRTALVPRGEPYGRFLRYALWARFSPAKSWLMGQVMFRNPSAGMLADLARFHRLSLTLDLPQTQVEVGRLLQHGDAPPAIRRSGAVGEVLGLVALGRPRAALARLDSTALSSGGGELALQRLEWPVVLAALGLPIDSASVSRARDSLAWRSFRGPHLARARFALGLDALARGDEGAAQQLADSLSVASEPVSQRLGQLLGARLAGLRGAHEEALHRSEPVFRLDSVSYRLGPFARSVTYLGRGDWQRALGRWQRADAEWSWYENSDLMGWPTAEPQQGEVDAMLAGYARLRRAELALEHGAGGAMCASLERVATLWRMSEPAWSPLLGRIATAKERIGCR